MTTNISSFEKLKEFQEKDFRQSSSIHFPKWTSTTPQMLLYQGCSSCSTDPLKPAIIVANVVDTSNMTSEQCIQNIKNTFQM